MDHQVRTNQQNRRNFLKQSALGVGALAGLPSLSQPLMAADSDSRIEALELLVLQRNREQRRVLKVISSTGTAGYADFPDIDYVAEKLNMTSRTLRRRLTREDSSYQEILVEVRYELAREYLATSTLPLEEISVLLGYSAPGNFSNAFKRWHGSSPREYRQVAC